MTEEERIFQGLLFRPGAQELRDIKLRTHNLCLRYNQTFEDDVETRAALLRQIVGAMGEDGFIQGPVQFHYGTHTTIGKRFFGNFNLTIQDDARVTIGDDVNCGPNVTIVTPVHPLLAGERRQMLGPDGQPAHLCYARPVTGGDRRGDDRGRLRDRRGQRGHARHTALFAGGGRALPGDSADHGARQHALPS